MRQSVIRVPEKLRRGAIRAGHPVTFPGLSFRRSERSRQFMHQAGDPALEQVRCDVDEKRRFLCKGFSHLEFHLHLTREAIDSYLGLKPETEAWLTGGFQGEEPIGLR
jgi:hypothetical protein